MIYFVSGKRDSGKTTRCHSLYWKLHGDKDNSPFGIISRKVFSADGLFLGYDIHITGTTVSRPLALTTPPINSPSFQHGRFHFIQHGFDFAKQVILQALHDDRKQLLLDEIGILEVNGKGFAETLRILLKEKHRDLYLGARTKHIPEIVTAFTISEYTILS